MVDGAPKTLCHKRLNMASLGKLQVQINYCKKEISLKQYKTSHVKTLQGVPKKRNIMVLCSFCLISPANINLQSCGIF